MALLICCAITHAAVCVMALHSNNTKTKLMGTLFGLQSLGCIVLTVYAGVHILRYARPRRRPRFAWSQKTDSADYLESSLDQALAEPSTNSCPMASLQRSACWTWLFVLVVGGVDVLWALCGVRSLWFVATLGHIPGGTRGPPAALVVGVIVCTVLLSMSPAVSTATWLDLPALVEVGCALLPSLFSLAQLVSADAPPQRSPHSSPRHSMSRSSQSHCHSRSSLRQPRSPVSPSRDSVIQDISFLVMKDRRIRQSVHKPLRYSVSKQIASGGFSDVFLGLSHDTGELICVKQLKAGFAESDIAAMETEVSLLKRLAHPNIVQYLGTDRGERFTILLGYVPGGSIALLLSQFGALEEELVTLYIHQAVRGLEYLHSEGIVHSDIKGANILVSDKGEVRLTDFGCSYCSRSADVNCLVMGTVLWMAPEVCRQEESNWSCDIWSLGCTILQMATNQEPWSEMQFEHTIPAFYHIATCQQPPQVSDTLCSPMQDVVRQCLQLEAYRRPTCHELLATPWLALDASGTDQNCSAAFSSPRWARLRAEESPAMAQGNAGPPQRSSNDFLKKTPPHLPSPGRLPTSRSVSPVRPQSNASGLPPRAHGAPAHESGWVSGLRQWDLSASACAPCSQTAGTRSMSASSGRCPSEDMPRSGSASIPPHCRSPALSYVVSMPRSAAHKVAVEGTPSMSALSSLSHASDDAPPSSDCGRPARCCSWRNQFAKQLEFLSTIDCEKHSVMELQAPRSKPRALQDQEIPQ